MITIIAIAFANSYVNAQEGFKLLKDKFIICLKTDEGTLLKFPSRYPLQSFCSIASTKRISATTGFSVVVFGLCKVFFKFIFYLEIF